MGYSNRLSVGRRMENLFPKLDKCHKRLKTAMVLIQTPTQYSNNRSVSKFIQSQNDKCEFCKIHTETIEHLFIKCNSTRTFWEDLSNLLNKNSTQTTRISLNEKLILFGESEEHSKNKTLNLILILAKHFIYKSKVQKIQPTLHHFKLILTQRHAIESLIQNSYNSNSSEPWAIFQKCITK